MASDEVKDHVAQEENLRHRRGVTRTQFTRKVNLFKDRLEKGDVLRALGCVYEDVEDRFRKLEMACEELINFYIEKSYDQLVIDEAEKYLNDSEQLKCDMYSLLLKCEKESVDEGTSLHQGKAVKLNIEAMKMPRFDGNIREFPAFIDEFNSIVVPSYGKNPAVLKQCLEGDPLRIITGCEKDYKEMMFILNKEYGDPRKIVDEVMNDLKRLRCIPDGDDLGFVKMVQKVDKCYLDLKKIGLESEMNCVNIVSTIEGILPREEKRRWVLKSQDISEREQYFPELLKFLTSERKVIEYCQSSVRNEKTKNVCVNMCGDSYDDQLLKMIKGLQEEQNNTHKLLSEVCVKLQCHNLNGVNTTEERWCWVHEFTGHDTASCGKFRSLTGSDRIELIKRKGGCFVCLEGRHLSRNCTNVKKCSIRVEGTLCGRRHHPLLHDAFVRNIGSVNSSGCSMRMPVLLDVMTVYSSSKVPIKILWDSGSNTTLITHSMARRLGCRGVPVSGTMTKVGNITESFNSKQYCIELLDRWGKGHKIVAMGMDDIAAPIDMFDLTKIVDMFPRINLKDLDRPSGVVDMLIGTDYSIFLPRPVAQADRLELTENNFGYSVRGCIPANDSDINVKINHVNFAMKFDITEIKRDDLKERLDNFFNIENSGTTCKPQCVRCLCRNCPVSEGRTLREERELALIERGLRYDEGNKEWVASYPWLKNPELLPNNYKAILGRLKSTERRLMLDSKHAKAYQEEMNDMQRRGVARKLDPKEIQTYVGPIHYIAHHAVMKPESLTTPLRIVFDSSTRFMGHTLNDYWAKGPNVLNSLVGILLRFRRNYVGLVGDVSKMYHSVKLEPAEEHVHRFLWRDIEPTRNPDQYVLTRVTFGDRPSGVIATMALRYTAGMQREHFPRVAQVIEDDIYMDDVLTSIEDIEEAKKLAGNIESVLKEGGFRIKHWIMSGSSDYVMDINLSEGMTHKILGMHWSTANDDFIFKIKVNFSKRSKGLHTDMDLTKEDCVMNFPTVLTRRMILSQIASIYDPLGLILPYVLKAKILMRSLITKGSELEGNRTVDWDEPVNEDMRNEWKSFFISLYDIQKLTFSRCIKPLGAIGNPTLLLFSDASQLAYGCCAYIRWTLDSGKFAVSLIAAKNRIAPIKLTTIPRLELCGAVLGVRLRQTLIEEMGMDFEEILHIVDSTIVRSQIQKESHSFKTFVATRVAEIQSKSKPSEWWWVESQNNVADFITRPRDPCELSKDTVWQNGPGFLHQFRKSWPLYQSVDETPLELCEDNLTCANVTQLNCQHSIVMSDFKIERFKTFSKLARVTSRVLSVFKHKSFRAAAIQPSVEALNIAERMWIMEAQRDINNWEVQYRNLGPSLEDGVIVVGSRIQSWLRNNWNKENYTLLPGSHPLSKLIITELHYADHGGVETTMAKLLANYWIPGARRIIKYVKGKCVKCRRLEKRTEEQCMGQVSEERLKPSPVFFHTATDIFGPFAIRDSVKRRTYGKCFGVIFTCLSSRAVHLDLTENYGTDAFLAALQRFTSIRGYPSSFHSDNGKQMIAANKELIKISEGLDRKRVEEYLSVKRVHWSFNRSSDAPWLNGSCESLIKSVKMSIQRAIGNNIMTYAELQSVLFEVANLINSRPIGIKPGYDIELGSYLCPNDLLLGRNNRAAPFGKFDIDSSSKRRLSFIQSVVTTFWRRWQRDYFPSLIIRKRWHTKQRNLQVGDIVLIQDSNAIRGCWKMGEVTSTEQGRDTLVRDVTVRYKSCVEGVEYEGVKDKFMKRSVHKLVLLLPIEER